MVRVLYIILIWGLVGCGNMSKDRKEQVREVSKPSVDSSLFHSKKVLYFDSYHPSYASSQKVRNAFQQQAQAAGISHQLYFLDAKNILDEEVLKDRGDSFKAIIDSIKPDLIVASDDAIQKYLVVPHLKDSALPVVFMGVNWGAKKYGYPAANITGQIEVDLLEKLVKDLEPVSGGKRIALLSGKTLTDSINMEHYQKILHEYPTTVSLVGTLTEWKREFLRLQKSHDILILRHNVRIEGWNDAEVLEFLKSKQTIPTGGTHVDMKDFVLLCYPRLTSEYGEYAASTAKRILSGTRPDQIPISKNEKSKIIINTVLSKKLGITFPSYLVETAEFSGTLD